MLIECLVYVRAPRPRLPRPDQRSVPIRMLIKLVVDEGREEASGAGRLKHMICPWRAQEDGGAERRQERKRERSLLQRACQILVHRDPGRPPVCTIIQRGTDVGPRQVCRSGGRSGGKRGRWRLAAVVHSLNYCSRQQPVLPGLAERKFCLQPGHS